MLAIMMMPFCTATPNRAMKPTAQATLSVSPVRWSAIRPPRVASGTTPRISIVWRILPNSAKRKTTMSASTMPMISVKPRLGALLAFELAAPLQAVLVVVEVDRLVDPALGLREIVGQGAVPVVDPHEQIAVAHFVRDGALAASAA